MGGYYFLASEPSCCYGADSGLQGMGGPSSLPPRLVLVLRRAHPQLTSNATSDSSKGRGESVRWDMVLRAIQIELGLDYYFLDRVKAGGDCFGAI